MARISYSKSANSVFYYVIEDYKRNGKRTTRKLCDIGNLHTIKMKALEEQIDINTWLNNYLVNYKKEHSIPVEYEEVIIKKMLVK